MSATAKQEQWFANVASRTAFTSDRIGNVLAELGGDHGLTERLLMACDRAAADPFPVARLIRHTMERGIPPAKLAVILLCTAGDL